MKNFFIITLILISIFSITSFARTETGEWEGFKWTWTDGEVYIEGKGPLPKKMISNLFDPPHGEEGLVINEKDEWKYEKVVLSEGITEIPPLMSYKMTVNYQAVFGEMVLPSTLTNIFSSPLRAEKITVHPDNPKYTSVDGVLFSKDKQTLLMYPPLAENEHYEIPVGTKVIGENAFDSALYLKSVNIPEGVEEIAAGAFCTANKLEKATFPKSLKKIGSAAFGRTKLKEFVIPEGIEVIESETFMNTQAERIFLPSTLKKIDHAAVNTHSLKYVYYGGSEEDWSKIEIKNIYKFSINDFGEATFIYNATWLPESDAPIETEPLNTAYPSGYLNDDKTVAWYIDADNVLHVHGKGQVKGYPGFGAGNFQKPWTSHKTDTGLYLKGLVVHEGINYIGPYAFSHYRYDTVELPESLEFIGDGAFAEAMGDKLTIRGVKRIDSYSFPRTQFKEIILPDDITYMVANCFTGAGTVKELRLPITLVQIEPNAIPNSVTDIYYEGSEKDFSKISIFENLSGVTIHYATPSFFADVPESHWAKGYIKTLYDKEIVGGVTPTTYKPEGTLTWGQALKLLLVATGHNLSPTRSHWASGFLDYAKFRQWIGPNEIDDTGLDEKITRLRFCQLAAGVKMIVAQPDTNPFTDTDDVMVLALYNAGIIGGTTPTTFSPDSFLTRAQIAKIICLLIGA